MTTDEIRALSSEQLRHALVERTMRWRSRQPIGHSTLPIAVQRLDDRERLAWFEGLLVIDGVDAAGLS